MSLCFYQHDGDARIAISGKFNFEIHREFSELTERAFADSSCKRLDIDLAGVAYLDSSALGMLLLARDKANTHHKSIRIVGAAGVPLQILQVARFQEMFAFA